jgi:hypothetical protein
LGAAQEKHRSSANASQSKFGRAKGILTPKKAQTTSAFFRPKCFHKVVSLEFTPRVADFLNSLRENSIGVGF